MGNVKVIIICQVLQNCFIALVSNYFKSSCLYHLMMLFFHFLIMIFAMILIGVFFLNPFSFLSSLSLPSPFHLSSFAALLTFFSPPLCPLLPLLFMFMFISLPVPLHFSFFSFILTLFGPKTPSSHFGSFFLPHPLLLFPAHPEYNDESKSGACDANCSQGPKHRRTKAMKDQSTIEGPRYQKTEELNDRKNEKLKDKKSKYTLVAQVFNKESYKPYCSALTSPNDFQKLCILCP